MKYARRLGSVLCGVTAAMLSAAPATAQQDTTETRPFVRGGVYDKPYLTVLAGRTAIGGYAEAHARVERTDGVVEERGIEAKRFNIFTATEVSDFIRVGAELEFEEGAEEIKLEYAAIDFRVSPAVGFRAGMLLSPLGRFNLSHDSPLNEFTDRPLVSTELLGTALSEPGLGAFGQMGLGGAGRVTYEIYAVNGFHEGVVADSPDGTRVPFGRGNFEDNNNSPAIVGRTAWSPSFGYEVGLSFHHGAYNEYNLEGVEVDERRDVTAVVFDAEASLFGFHFQGEGALLAIDIPSSLEGLFARTQRGLFAELLRDFAHGMISTMPQSYFTGGLRFDVVDFDGDLAGDAMRQLTLGLNFRPTAETALKLNYMRGWSRDRFNNPADHAGVQLSIATYF